MDAIKYELKYCEGCGALRLRPVSRKLPPCRVCEAMLKRVHFPSRVLAAGWNLAALSGEPGVSVRRGRRAAMAVPAGGAQ